MPADQAVPAKRIPFTANGSIRLQEKYPLAGSCCTPQARAARRGVPVTGHNFQFMYKPKSYNPPPK